MPQIKKIDALSLAKVFALTVTVIYLLIGFLLSIITFIAQGFLFKAWDWLGLGSSVLVSMIVALITGCLFFLISAVWAWVYNWLSKLVGGIKIELVEESTKPSDFKQ